MKKITLSLVFLLTMIMGSYGQVAYEFGWEPTTAPMGEWTTTSSYGFSRQTITPCAGLASVRANTYSSATSTLTSPLLPNSNGGIITLNFDYKVTLYNPNTTGAPANQVDIEVQTSNSATGPWIAVEYINENNHTVSATCAAKTFNFSALPGDFYLRFVTKAINGADVYYYFDNVSITQGVAPSCIPPAVITASAITSNSATITWGAASPVPSGGYEYYVSTSNDAPPASGTVSAGLTANLTSLLDNTVQYVWVRSMCDSGSSVWNGPITFKTLCVPFGDFNENFDTSTAGTGLVPSCWNKIVVSTTTFANVSVISNTASSTPNAISMTNSDDANAQLYLVTPSLSAIGANTHRMKFKARGGSAGQILSVGTMSNPNDPSTYVELQSYTLTAAYATYNVTLNTSTTANFVAFKHGLGGTYRTVYLDDMIWEPIPTEAPGCIEDMNAVINEGCGNFPTTFTWAAVPGSDGYKVSIGTSANGADLVVSNLDIFSALNYSFVGNPGTTYYYTITPYNANGSAVDCYEDTFTTYDDGCYCVALPTSNDGAGISSVQINGVVTPVTDVFYANFTENGAIDITQGVNTVMNVTLATGYGYWTDVWVDYNDNYTFEASELVYSSTAASSSTNPTIVNTSFMTSLTAPIGEHRMRIVSSDSKKNPANPCYSSSYGVALDFLVNVTPAPDCLPPTASTVSNITADGAQLNWISEGTLFNVETLFAGESQGSGSVTSGIAANTVTLTGLDPQTNYEYYVQTDCGNGSLSPWTGPFTFRTGCESFGNFTENFTTDVNYTSPECWYSIKQTEDQYAYIENYSYNDYMLFYNSNDSAAQLYLITPSLTDLPLNTHRIKFRAYCYSAGTSLIIGTMTDPSNASTFTAVETIPMTSSYADYAVSFLNSTTDLHVAFKFVGTAEYQYLYLDDVVWESTPSCPDIYLVNVTGSTSSTADIVWTPGGTETAWQYAVALASETDPSSATPIDVSSGSSATASDLDPATDYKVWVRSVCGSDFGQWSPSVTFKTACIAFDTPFEENFDTFLPNCWSNVGAGTIATGPTGAVNGIWAADGFLNVGTTGAVKVNLYSMNRIGWLVTPTMNTTVGEDYSFSFNYGATAWNLTTPTMMGTDDFVKVVLTTDNGATWTEIHSFTAASNVSNTSQVYNYEFAAPTTQAKFALLASDGTVDDLQDYDFFVDSVAFSSNLATDDFDKNSFTAYPNPVKDVLNVSFNQNISNLTVYNLLGQQVLFMNMNASKGQVDMSALATGTYLVKVNTENGLKTIKVIKE